MKTSKKPDLLGDIRVTTNWIKLKRKKWKFNFWYPDYVSKSKNMKIKYL